MVTTAVRGSGGGGVKAPERKSREEERLVTQTQQKAPENAPSPTFFTSLSGYASSLVAGLGWNSEGNEVEKAEQVSGHTCTHTPARPHSPTRVTTHTAWQ